jgi:hypothetical protein
MTKYASMNIGSLSNLASSILAIAIMDIVHLFERMI